MNWITGMQRAIDYIEDNLTQELIFSEIAKRAYSSNFHFQRVFSILCGCTLGEYIRNRRLTLAGSELISSNSKIIDIALKYGYDSPESFSRAFTRFHGITPSQAKMASASLKSFSRLSLKLILEGGTVMDYKIEKKGAFPVIVKRKRFSGGEEISKKQIQAFWAQCQRNGTMESLCKHLKQDGVFGNAIVGISYDNPCEKEFDYAIGASCEEGEKAEALEGLAVEMIPAHTWVIFKCVGPMPDAFDELWKKIYTEFFPTSEYQPTSGFCLEVYPDDKVQSENFQCEIWLTVEKNNHDK